MPLQRTKYDPTVVGSQGVTDKTRTRAYSAETAAAQSADTDPLRGRTVTPTTSVTGAPLGTGSGGGVRREDPVVNAGRPTGNPNATPAPSPASASWKTGSTNGQPARTRPMNTP